MVARKVKQADRRRKASTVSGSVISADYRKQHKPDAFAVRLRKRVVAADGSIDPAKLRALAEKNGVWNARYGKLNAGMAFMTVSVRLRTLVRNGGKVAW